VFELVLVTDGSIWVSKRAYLLTWAFWLSVALVGDHGS